MDDDDWDRCPLCQEGEAFFKNSDGLYVCEECLTDDDEAVLEDAKVALACAELTTDDLLGELHRRLEAEQDAGGEERCQRLLKAMLLLDEVEAVLDLDVLGKTGSPA